MKRALQVFFALLTVTCAAWPSRAALLFTRDLTVDRSVNIFTSTEFSLEFLIADSYFEPTNSLTLLSDTLTPNVQKQLVAEAGQPSFDPIAGRLSDGKNEFIRLILTEKSSGRAEKRGWQESGLFAGATLANLPDFKHYVVQKVEVKVNSFVLSGGATPAAAAAASQPVELKLTFNVYGVPEPATGLSAAVGLAALAAGRYTGRRRRRSA